MNSTYDPLEVMAVVFNDHYKRGYQESDGDTMRDIPIRNGSMTLEQFSAEVGYASGWNARVWSFKMEKRA